MYWDIYIERYGQLCFVASVSDLDNYNIQVFIHGNDSNECVWRLLIFLLNIS